MTKADLHVKLAGGQQVVGGYSVSPYPLGPSSGVNYILNPLLGNYQWITNTGAWTLTAPTVDCAVDLMVINSSTAGAITFSGFTVNSNTGEAFTTTDTHKFILSVRRINGISTYMNKALQ